MGSFYEPLGLQLTKKRPTYYGPQLFVVLFTTTPYFSLSSPRIILSAPYFMIPCNILLPQPRSSNQSPFQSLPNSNFVCIYLLSHTAIGSTLGIRNVISLMISLCEIFPLNPKFCLVRSRNHKAPHCPSPPTLAPYYSLPLNAKIYTSTPQSRTPCACVL